MAGTAILGWLTLLLVAADPAHAPTDAPPSADLLMYLGEFQDAQGDFVDPLAVAATEPAGNAPAADKDDEDHEQTPRQD